MILEENSWKEYSFFVLGTPLTEKKFRQDYSTGSNTEEVSFKNNQTSEQSMVSEKAQYSNIS